MYYVFIVLGKGKEHYSFPFPDIVQLLPYSLHYEVKYNGKYLI